MPPFPAAEAVIVIGPPTATHVAVPVTRVDRRDTRIRGSPLPDKFVSVAGA